MGHASSGHGKLTKVVADHLGLDIDFNEVLTVVNGDAASDELWKNGHVSAVRANGFGTGALHSCEEVFVLECIFHIRTDSTIYHSNRGS